MTEAKTRKTAHPIPRDVFRPGFSESFWAKTAKVGDCIEWQLSLDGRGYGRVRVPKTRTLFRSHRVAYFLAKGKDPGDKWVLHRCDNPKCCNPDHLFLGDDKTNAKDKVRKGRAYTGDRNGEKNHNALMTNETAMSVIFSILAGLNNVEIEKLHGVKRATVGDMRRGRAWRSVAEQAGYSP